VLLPGPAACIVALFEVLQLCLQPFMQVDGRRRQPPEVLQGLAEVLQEQGPPLGLRQRREPPGQALLPRLGPFVER
jgi:hypothetical protein